MATSLSRRLIPISNLLLRNPNPSPRPLFLLQSPPLSKPYLIPFQNLNNPFPFLKHYSSNPSPNPDEFKHQEIEGPTVERDDSALANETRQALTSLRKSIYVLSSSLALLSFAHLGLGAYIAYASPQSTDAASMQGLAAFAFPFSIALLMRRSLKPMSFFHKMEEQGRLQILILSLQSVKSINVLFVRMRVASICCVVLVAAGTSVTLWLK